MRSVRGSTGSVFGRSRPCEPIRRLLALIGQA
jgi:hypothetical protein